MKRKHRIALLGIEPGATNFLKKNLEDVLGDAVDIKAFLINSHHQSVPEISEADLAIPLILTNYGGFYNDAKLLFPYSEIIIVEKILTGFNLEKVLMLPAGEKVLVINQPRPAAVETAENLMGLGITHLDYIPYIPGDPCPPDVYTAICIGPTLYSPPPIKHVIDIGYRTFSIDTWNRLIKALNLDSRYLDKLVEHLRLPLILSNNKLAEYIQNMRLMGKEMELISNKVPDAIMSVSWDKNIISLNKAMEAALGKPYAQLVGKPVVQEFLPISNEKDLIYDLDENISAKITLKNVPYLYNLATMQEGTRKNYIFTFKKTGGPSAIGKTNSYAGKYYLEDYVTKYRLEDFWGSTPNIRDLKNKAQLFAQNDMNVLLYGESGTGKEILAQSIHGNSLRKDAPFLAINLAAITESLIESELFGYESGAFTGAKKEGKSGYFEMASGGTLFLDEIGSMPLPLQARLLRVLQEREVMRVGGSRIIPVDIRIIAATNIDLKKQVAEGNFRQDLYFRLNVLSLHTVPLRYFKEDIQEMIKKYLYIRYSFKADLSNKKVNDVLQSYDWPGNVRELFNAADYIYYSSCGESMIMPDRIPQYILDEYSAGKVTKEEIVNGKALFVNKKEAFLTILNVFDDQNGQAIGRRELQKLLAGKNVNISEYYLKILLESMKTQQLIKPGTTKQGTRITDKGRHFLRRSAKT